MKDRLELGLGVALIVGGIVSALLYAFVFVDPTEPGDWASGAAWVIERTGKRDVVRIEPFWYESALVELRPVGDRVQRIRDPIVEDLYKADHILILTQADRAEQALGAIPFDAAEVESATFGTVSAHKLKVPASPFSWEMYDELGSVRVSRVKGGEVEVCDRWSPREGRWDCAQRNQWLYVGREEREVGDDPRQCIWAHPLDGGRTLRLEVDVPPAKKIRIRDSFDLRAARLGGADALMQVFVGDELQLEDRVKGNDHDWQAHEIDVSRMEGPTRLRIEIDLLGSVKNRFFCLNAWAVR